MEETPRLTIRASAPAEWHRWTDRTCPMAEYLRRRRTICWYLTLVPISSSTSDWMSASVIRLMWPFLTFNATKTT